MHLGEGSDNRPWFASRRRAQQKSGASTWVAEMLLINPPSCSLKRPPTVRLKSVPRFTSPPLLPPIAMPGAFAPVPLPAPDFDGVDPFAGLGGMNRRARNLLT